MSFKVKVKGSPFKKLENDLKKVRTAVTKAAAVKAGDAGVQEMKKLISKGTSPIEGGSFPAYRGKYREDIKKGRYKGKSLSPVNLKLSGKFLKSLKSLAPDVVKGGSYQPRIGLDKRVDRKAGDKETGHREGANKQAIRPNIPQDGEDLKQGVLRKIADYLTDVVDKYVKRNLR